jgi:aldehyde dehydrogenase
MLHQVIDTLKARVALRPRYYDNFIGGTWVAPVDGRYFDNISPITGKTGVSDRALAGRRWFF